MQFLSQIMFCIRSEILFTDLDNKENLFKKNLQLTKIRSRKRLATPTN